MCTEHAHSSSWARGRAARSDNLEPTYRQYLNVSPIFQGEGAPVVRKGCCANHLAEVERFFKGHQLTINARSDDEVEPRAILDLLIKCCAAASIRT